MGRRKQRAVEQQILLLGHTRPAADVQSFQVLGTTDEYRVKVVQNSSSDRRYDWSCSCPDFRIRRQKCKHVYFVLSRVLRRTSEEFDLNDHGRSAWEAGIRLLDQPQQPASSSSSNSISISVVRVERKNPVGDCCPFCRDDFSVDEKEDLVYCKLGCGKNVHEVCLARWFKRGHISCVFCRSLWDSD